MPLPIKPSKRLLYIAIVLTVLLLATLIFGIWALQGRQDYKNKADQKAATAAAAAAKDQSAKDQAAFDEQNKAPYKNYTGSPTFGSVSFGYPKSWSAYVDETSSSEPINGYFHPSVVPGVQSATAFALRLELVNTAYSDVISQFQSEITSGSVTAAAYIPPKMKGVANVQPGIRLDGTIGQDNKTTGSMVVIRVRDKTLQIYTLSNNYLNDFNNIILPSLSFSP